MRELIENTRAILDNWGEFVAIILNALSLLSIIMGVVMCTIRSTQYRRQSKGYHPLHTHFRLIFGGWLVVALEFQLASDIAETIISPTKEHLIELAVVAVIRTFLNYFLGKELNEEKETLEELAKNSKEENKESHEA